MTPLEALQQAINFCGSQERLGRVINRRQSAISYWVVRGEVLAPEAVLAIERHTGVSRHDLRPDIYGPRENGT